MTRWDLLSEDKYQKLLAELKNKLDDFCKTCDDSNVEQLQEKVNLMNLVNSAENKSSNTDKWVICDICHKPFQVAYNTFKHSGSRNGNPWRCPECLRQIRSERAITRNADPKFREAQLNGIKSWYDNMSEDELRAQINKTQDKLNNKSPEEKRAIYEKVKRSWESKSDEEMSVIRHRLSIQAKNFWDLMSDDRYSEFVKKISDSWNNMSEDDRNLRRERISSSRKKYYESLSYEEMEMIRNNARNVWGTLSDDKKQHAIEKINEYWSSRTEEEMEAWRNLQLNRWKSLNPNVRAEYIHKSVITPAGKNNLHKKFESRFNDSCLYDDYTIISEYVSYNETIHSWDYGIFTKDANSLVMVVDLDGAYFHADECDYDGIHSKEEYDEKRSLSIPDNVKWFIIHESSFSKDFSEMIKLLMTDYDEFIDKLFRECKASPFPYMHYTDKELLKSYESLRKMNCNDKHHQDISLNTRLGDRLIQHFHHSIWHAHIKGKPSPYDAWNDDELLRRVIENRVIYQNYLNPNKILQGFNVSRIATKVSVFSAGRAKLIINKYLSEYDNIFDPFSGFSGRMLGTISLGKRYIGQDISEIHVNESNNMIEFLREYRINVHAEITQGDSIITTGTYPSLFTCPPYGDKEIWIDSGSTLSCDEWIDICLKNFRCNRYVFVVDDTVKYKDYIKDTISNRSHFNNNQEYVIVIDRED